MEVICPICNGLVSYLVKCNACGGSMEAHGAVQDYFDDYSPYLQRQITEKMDGVDSDEMCLHFFYCPNCSSDRTVPVDKFVF